MLNIGDLHLTKIIRNEKAFSVCECVGVCVCVCFQTAPVIHR